MPKDDGAHGIDQQTVRRLLTATPGQALAAILLKGTRENKTFRRKVLAWLIDRYADQLPAEAVRSAASAWIADVLAPGEGMPRPPAVRDLAAVRTAVRRHPAPALFAHLAVVEAAARWLSRCAGGPHSRYSTYARHFESAVAALTGLEDERARLVALSARRCGCWRERHRVRSDHLSASARSRLGPLFPHRGLGYDSVAKRSRQRRGAQRGPRSSQ